MIHGCQFPDFLTLFFYLHEAKLERGLSSEDLDHHFQLALLFIYLFNNSRKAVEGTVYNFYGFAYAERNVDFFLACCELINLSEYAVYLCLADRHRVTGRCSQEPKHIGNVAQYVRHFSHQGSFYDYISRKECPLFAYLLTRTNLVDLFGGYQNLCYVILKLQTGYLILEILLHLLLLAADSPEYIPLLNVLTHL